jgi:REP element-mobilizing transposase RayT
MSVIAPGYFLTWHTYGTWLHGDDAGSVDRGHNEFGTPRLAPDRARFERALGELKTEPLVLSNTARILVGKVMRDHCAIRAWDLRALSVRSNHVHVVIADPTVKPEFMVQQLKDWGTRKLRSHRIIGTTQRAWAEHASTIYLFEPGSLEAKIKYVNEMQDGNEGREAWDVKLGLR